MERQARIQESRYQFPYHYIPGFENGDFVQARTLSWGLVYLAYLRFVIGLIRSLPFDSLLDIGCGDGRLLCELCALYPDKILVGIDTSESAIRYARALSPNVEYVCGDVVRAGELKREFDIATAIEVLEHVPPEQVGDFLRGIHERLKPDGVLIVTVPSANVPVARKHYRHFDLESLRAILSPRFTVSEHHFLNKTSRAAKYIKRLLVNRWFILNHRRLLNWLYRYYEKHLLEADERTAKRICAVCRKCQTGQKTPPDSSS
jgi:2-polyprenyl-3-methyl-5-hydroxy-6-metoxy-1,4-benzoquinol methylase